MANLKIVDDTAGRQFKATKELDAASSRLRRLKTKIEEKTLYDVPHLTDSQLLLIRKLLLDTKRKLGDEWRSYLRVGVLHHHLVPFHQQVTEHKPFEAVADSARVLDLLAESDIPLVFTGHKHQPYVTTYAVNGKEILLVGGPTVGGQPAIGAPQGFRHLDVRRENGQLSVGISDIPIEAAAQNIEEYTREPRQYRIEEEGFKRHGGEFCFHLFDTPPSVKHIFTKAADSESEIDRSDEFFIFANVISCEKARKSLRAILPKLRLKDTAKGLSFWGIYDAYGRFDIVVRGEARGWARAAMTMINDHLESRGLLQKGHGGSTCSVDVLDVKHFKEEGFGGMPVANQQDYDRSRWYKAFIVIPKSRDFDDVDIRTLSSKIENFLEESDSFDRNHCMLYRGMHHCVIEVLLKCGQYYQLCKLTRNIEKFVDQPEMQKMTHIVYYHEESQSTADATVAGM